MRVCIAATSFNYIYPETQGAINNYVFELSKRLSQEDEVYLLGRGHGKFQRANLHVKPFSYWLPPALSTHALLREFSYGSLYSQRLILQLQKINRQKTIQIFHINNVFETPVSAIVKKIFHSKTVFSVHNIFRAPLLTDSCDKILANSHYMKRFLIDQVNVTKHKVDVLPIGVDIEFFKSHRINKAQLGLSSRPIVLYIGRKVWYKGPQVLIDALPIVSKAYPDVLSILIGPDYFFGSKKDSFSNILKDRARRLGVEKNVLFQSFIPLDRLLKFLNAADMLVCPSIWQEPFGKVVLEANACEKPVIATNVGGLPELIKNKENGLLIPPNDPKSLANAILKLLGDKNLAKSMGLKGRLIVKNNFSYDVVSRKCRYFYESIL